jgi:diacylglycerol kinase family enzyme
MYHLPLGTENLFAREFGMNVAMPTLLAAIDRRDIRRVDVGVANARWFLLMASVGFDAEVVHALAATRGGSISHLTYVKPIIHTMRTWRPPVLTVEVGGDVLVDAQPGIVVVANSRQYGWRIDPAGRASMSDGLLDVVFLPAKSIPQLLMWVARCRMRQQFANRSLAFAQGKDVLVRCEWPQHYQLDGDPPGVVHELLPQGLDARGHTPTEDETGRPLSLRASICPGLLPVLAANAGP